MATDNRRYEVGYGLTNALQSLADKPIVTTRAPATADKGKIGQNWINKSTNSVYILTSNAGGSTWTLIPSATAGGAWSGTTLTASGAVSFSNSTFTLANATWYNGALVTGAAGVVTATNGGAKTVLMGRTATAGAPTFGELTSTGGTINISVSGNNINFENSGSLSPFTSVVASPHALVANNGCAINFAGVATLNLPATAVLGQTIEIVQVDRTVGRGFQIALNGNTLRYGGQTPTTLTFLNRALPSPDYHGSIYLVSIAANTWAVFGMPLGNFVVA